MRAREQAGKAQPCKLTVDDVAAAATSAHDILVKASEQLEELVEAERSDSATCPVAGDWARFRDTWIEFVAYRRAALVLAARGDAGSPYVEEGRWERARDSCRRLIPACVCVRVCV